ncbi:hypothetical protein RIF29_33545 [Crotalaria pallida]|uniref:HTH La-type RNA-binding domain-containing protein n=1 Tax=Crotalaria pallida TaxID=3830 RepID=A0AAN9E879_CROPI
MALCGPSSEESVSAVTDNGFKGHNGNNTRKSAWNNKPSNEGPTSELKPPFMGADSWPPLSESTRPSVKSPSPSPSVPQSQGSGSVLPSPRRLARDNANTNNVVPAQEKEKSFKRSNSNPSYNGGNHSQPSSSHGSMPSTGFVSHNSSPKDHQTRHGFVSNDHPHQRNSYRNRNGGPNQRGDGAHHHNYGIRRDQDFGNHDWNARPNFNGRDNYMLPRFGPRFTRHPPPPSSTNLFPQQPLMQPFGWPIGYPELPPQMVYGPPPPLDALRGVLYMPQPPIPPPHSMLFPSPDPQLHSKILNQIDYYFSDENLVKDVYLRKKMDDQGWVPINLIAGFKKVKQLTDSIRIVLDAVGTSSVVEVQGDKVRRQNDWWRWIMPSNNTGSQTIGKLADQVQNVALETVNNDGTGGLDVLQNRLDGDLNSWFPHSSSEGTGQVGIQISDHSISARN